jgi:hypothetical protein
LTRAAHHHFVNHPICHLDLTGLQSSKARHVVLRIGIGRLPGDFNFRLFGREWSIPLTSTILLSILAALIARYI